MNKIYNYQNGNYSVDVYEDGTKIRNSQESEFIAEFPDSVDVKITNYCDLSNVCVYCHEKSDRAGIHGDLSLIETAWKELPSGVELACGGGDTLSHPDFPEFAKRMTENRKIINLTCNQLHLKKYAATLSVLTEKNYIRGLGVSLRDVNQQIPKTIMEYPNTIFHCIAGIDSANYIRRLIDICAKPKILLLGYKNFGNGIQHLQTNGKPITKNIQLLYNQLPVLLHEISKKQGILSFDNLAIAQLNPKRVLSESDYDRFYQGEDGKNTFYVDVVTKTFARNSTSTERFPILPSAKLMFRYLNSPRH